MSSPRTGLLSLIRWWPMWFYCHPNELIHPKSFDWDLDFRTLDLGLTIWKCSDSTLTGKCCTLEKVSYVWWSPARCKAEAWLGSEDCSGRDLSSEPEIILYSFMRIRNVCFKVLIGQLYWKLKVKLHLFYPKSWLIPCLKIQTFEEDLTVNFKIPNSMRNETQEVLMAMFN